MIDDEVVTVNVLLYRFAGTAAVSASGTFTPAAQVSKYFKRDQKLDDADGERDGPPNNIEVAENPGPAKGKNSMIAKAVALV